MISKLKEAFGFSNPRIQQDAILVLTENQEELVLWMMWTLQSPRGADNFAMRQSEGCPAELVVPNNQSLEIWRNVLDCYDRGLFPRIVESEKFNVNGQELTYSTICFDSDQS